MDQFTKILFDGKNVLTTESAPDKNFIYDWSYPLYVTGSEEPPVGSGWTGIICSVTDPTKVIGIATANITKINGIGA
jgi:hypothetical protein